jgi:thiopurine S-methyltransferase
VGDVFNLSPNMLGKIDAVYDRAALVALPEDIRKLYTAHLMKLTLNLDNKAQQLLICFEYDQALHAGPPFSMSANEVQQLYQANYFLTLLGSSDVVGGLKGQCPATEHVWWLKPI